ATAEEIVLSFSSPSQNCGMNLLGTPLTEQDLSPRFLDALMAVLREELPRRRRSPVLLRPEVVEMCRKGAPAAAARFGVDPSQCETMEWGGDALAGEEPPVDEVLRAADRRSLEAGRYSFAYIGGGNHFLELQVVTETFDPAACRAMGLEKGRVVAMFHTGSERLGHDLGRLYAFRRKTDPRRRRKLFWRKVALHLTGVRGPADLRRRWQYHFRRRDFIPVPSGSPEGRRLLLTLRMAANFGYANRVAVAGLIQAALRKALGAPSAGLRLLADLSHNTIDRERIEGKDLWVHRHNAARVVGPSGLPAGHPWRAIGQPLMLPGTNRTSSFVMVGRDGSVASLHSVDHGAGRTVERFEQAGRLALRPAVTRKYTYQRPEPELLQHLSDEGIDEVVAVAAACGLAVPAARLRPAAVLKA
ncbi:MAG TPA: RtcB family protein, partial [Candidatus Polarisedimenticolia bacterium]|nr:RtcB family protein [Candidatus Polarisedimenticolia bacterium]